MNDSWDGNLGSPTVDPHMLSLLKNELNPAQLFGFVKVELFRKRKDTNNEFRGSEDLKEMLENLLGVASLKPEAITLSLWSLDKKLTLIGSLLKGFPSLSEDMVELLLYYLILNQPTISSFTSYSIGLHEHLVKTTHISTQILVDFVNWIVEVYSNPINYYFFDYEPLKFIFSHPKFPKGALLEYCYSVVPHIREAVAESPNCSEEGRVAVALLRETD